MSRPALTRAAGHINRRAIWSRIVIAACYGAGAIVVLPLALIVWHLLAKGLPALSLSFFLDMPKPVGEPGGGMANAIVGTLILVGLGALFAVPVGVGAGVYLAEFGRGRFSSLVRYTADLLSGLPSGPANRSRRRNVMPSDTCSHSSSSVGNWPTTNGGCGLPSRTR